MNPGDDKEIINRLKKLPKVVDQTDKEEWHSRISSKISEEKKPVTRRQTRVLISTIGFSLVAMILLLLLPSIINEVNPSQNQVKEDSNSAHHIKKVKMVDEPSTTNHFHSEEVSDENPITNPIPESKVMYNINNEQQIVYSAVSDDQLQYLIPFSFIVPNDESLSDYYSTIGSRINFSEDKLGAYMFDNVSFDINVDEKEVVMNLPESFTISDGSANATMFINILTEMFIPYDIEKIVFQSDKNQAIDLGAIGEITELPLIQELYAYKKYESPNEDKSYLIPIPQDRESTVDEALRNLKDNEEDFHVYATIPENVNFSIRDNHQQLIVELENNNSLANEEEFITMIEAILMTAKSYGYETVKFENTKIDQIGSYLLTEPIFVPDAVNPIEVIDPNA